MPLMQRSLPPRAGGRRYELDAKLLSDIVSALKNTPTVNDRPNVVGPDTAYKTKGQASNIGQHYQKALKEQGIKVRVNVVGENLNNKQEGDWRWGVYIPLSDSQPAS